MTTFSSKVLSHIVNTLRREKTAINEGLIASLLESPIALEDVQPWLHFDPEARCRTLVAGTESFEVILIGWLPGQSSSLHDHGPSDCVFRVIQGTAEERRYRHSEAPTHYQTLVHEACALARVVPGEAHIVANASPDIPLVTLHIYSPPLLAAPPVRLEKVA